MGDSVRSSNCFERLFSDFKEALELKTTLDNYTIVNNGCRNPIFLTKDKDSLLYKLYNTRIKIIIESEPSQSSVSNEKTNEEQK